MLVARLLGVAEFALGSTMVFRAEILRAIGGFAAIADYLADDYQLGPPHHQTRPAHRVFAPVVVETDLGGESWRADLAAPVALVAHHPRVAALRLLRLRGHPRHALGAGGLCRPAMVGGRDRRWRFGCMAAGLVVGAGILRRSQTSRDFWLIPLRDLFGFAVWLGGAFGHKVDWRGRRLLLDPDGRICNKS